MAVYLIGNKARGLLKIGYSKDPEVRLKALQTGCSDPLVILQVLTNGCKRVEKHLQGLFREYHVHGEWYLDKKAIRAGFYSLGIQNRSRPSILQYLTALGIQDQDKDEIEKGLEGQIVRMFSHAVEESQRSYGWYEIVSAYQIKRETAFPVENFRCLLVRWDSDSRDFREEIAYRRSHTNGRLPTKKYLLNSGTYDLKRPLSSMMLGKWSLFSTVRDWLFRLDLPTEQITNTHHIFHNNSRLFGWGRLADDNIAFSG